MLMNDLSLNSGQTPVSCEKAVRTCMQCALVHGDPCAPRGARNQGTGTRTSCHFVSVRYVLTRNWAQLPCRTWGEPRYRTRVPYLVRSGTVGTHHPVWHEHLVPWTVQVNNLIGRDTGNFGSDLTIRRCTLVSLPGTSEHGPCRESVR